MVTQREFRPWLTCPTWDGQCRCEPVFSCQKQVPRDYEDKVRVRLLHAKLECALADVRWCIANGHMKEMFDSSARNVENHLLILMAKAAQ